jgi:thiol-disulfide isomerase/thioredoxin
MRKLFQIQFILLIAFLSVLNSSGQKIEYIKVPDLEKILKNTDNRLFVLNLWATWCAPCVKELPYFEKVAKEYDPGKVKFILVSLDFPSQIKNQLIPFLKKNKISIDVAIMTDLDYNSWIEKVDPDWQGNIPATLIFNNSRKQHVFYPGELDEKELRNMINKYLL